MSARAIAVVAVCVYAPIYALMLQSVPRKFGLGFVSRLRVHYATTDWSFWIEWMQALFSIGTVILFVVDSYYWEASYVALSMKLEVFFAVFFSFNFLFELLLSKNRWAFGMSLLGMVDLVTIVPVFVALSTEPIIKSPTGFVRLYRVLMLARVFKPFRLMRAVESLSPGNDAVMEQTAKTMAYFVSTLFLASGLVQVLSDGRTDEWGEVPDSIKMTFHDALYFIIITFSTVGYGDISPPDTQSRLAIVLLVGFFFFMIPRELNKLNHLLDLSSKYTGFYPKKLAGGHTIVGCDVASCALVASFLEEFFHEDHGYNIMHLVLLVPHEPTMEWKRLVLKFATNDRVTYLKGDLRSTADLTRVSANTASSCFILTNRHGNLREEEKRGFMRAITVQDFNPTLRIFVEAPTQAMRQRLVKVGINPTRIVCASTINTRMLANACAWEGASTLINNLLVSASIDEQRDMPSWVKEYACGLGKEIYVVSIGVFAGRGFSELVRELFELHGVILLGISEDRRVVLHPGAGYVITKADLGFLVADDADVAESIVEQAGGALLPFSQRRSSSSQSLSPKRLGEEAGAKRGQPHNGAKTGAKTLTAPAPAVATDLAASTNTMGLTADARTAGVIPRLGRTVKCVGRNRGRGGGDCSRSFPKDPPGSAAGAVKKDGSVAADRAARTVGESSVDQAKLYGTNHLAGEEISGAFPSVLPPPSPSSPRNGRDFNHDADERRTGHLREVGHRERGTTSSPQEAVTANNRNPSYGGEGVGGGTEGGYVVVVTPTLAHVSTLVEAFEAPQVPTMGFVVVCPLYDWNQERDQEEIRRLRTFPQVRLVVGTASRASLREAGTRGARMVVLRAGKNFPDQEASDADAESIGQLVEVTAVAGQNVHAIVELNDMTYGNHYEILVELLSSSKPPSQTTPPSPSPPAVTEHRGSTDTAAAVDPFPHRTDSDNGFSPSSTFGTVDNRLLSDTAVASFSRNDARRGGPGWGGGKGPNRWRWWRRLFNRQDRNEFSEQPSPANVGGGILSAAATVEGATASLASTSKAREGRRGRVHWTLTKGVASGAIVPSSLPETLLCQAFYNPAIIMIVEALLDPKALGGSRERERRRPRNEKKKKGEGGVRRRRSARDADGVGVGVAGDNDPGYGGDEGERTIGGGGGKGGGKEGGRGGAGAAEGGAGAAGTGSFLAQIVPPKRFFRAAMLGGHRPNFQALMDFMLCEYDALPFGLLRHGKVESSGRTAAEVSPKFVHCCPDQGQKVMPLDKVFLLSPNLESWERMQLDSPTSHSHHTAPDPLQPEPTGKPSSTSPRITPPPFGVGAWHGQGTKQSASQRGFPPEPANAVTDGRGFPLLEEDFHIRNRSSHHLYRPIPSTARGGGGDGVSGAVMPHDNADTSTTNTKKQASPPSEGIQNQKRNLFLSPFSSTLPPEKSEQVATSIHDANRTSWVGRGATGGSGRFRSSGGGGTDGHGNLMAGRAGAAGIPGLHAPPPPSPSRQTKGSHAKLDLLLHEMQRLNGRLDTMAGRLGALEEECTETGRGMDA